MLYSVVMISLCFWGSLCFYVVELISNEKVRLRAGDRDVAGSSSAKIRVLNPEPSTPNPDVEMFEILHMNFSSAKFVNIKFFILCCWVGKRFFIFAKQTPLWCYDM